MRDDPLNSMALGGIQTPRAPHVESKLCYANYKIVAGLAFCHIREKLLVRQPTGVTSVV